MGLVEMTSGKYILATACRQARKLNFFVPWIWETYNYCIQDANIKLEDHSFKSKYI